jgi:hypothetical protein
VTYFSQATKAFTSAPRSIFAPFAEVMDELEEAQIAWQLFL